MAKSRLMAAVRTHRTELENELDGFIRKCHLGDVSLDDTSRLMRKLLEFEKAIDDMDAHMQNLHRRENNPKVADRLRNLKNIFKDKQTLSNERTMVEAQFGRVKHETEGLRKQVKDEIDEITGVLMGV